MSRDPYDPQIDAANQLTRIADALERLVTILEPRR